MAEVKESPSTAERYLPWAGRTWARRCWAPLGEPARSRSWTPAGAGFCETSASSHAPSCRLWTPANGRAPINGLYFDWWLQYLKMYLKGPLPGSAWACSSPPLEPGTHPCSATDGLGKGTHMDHRCITPTTGKVNQFKAASLSNDKKRCSSNPRTHDLWHKSSPCESVTFVHSRRFLKSISLCQKILFLQWILKSEYAASW